MVDLIEEHLSSKVRTLLLGLNKITAHDTKLMLEDETYVSFDASKVVDSLTRLEETVLVADPDT